MEYTKLGKTGLTVSVAGLGCGGGSRLGMNRGLSTAESVALVHTAMDLGVNYLDTAAVYGTEGIVGEAIKIVPRDEIFVATKASIRKGMELIPVEDVLASLDNSLRVLDSDYVDVFQFHAVPPALYGSIRDEYVPALLREKEKGKLRHLGLTETPPNDAAGEMLVKASRDPVWEVIMLGFHMMHQVARRNCFPGTMENGADYPPPEECAPLWHATIFDVLNKIEFTLLVGSYAQAYYLRDKRKKSLTETVRTWQEYLPKFCPIPHPSWRTRSWQKNNMWFDEEVLPDLRTRVHDLLR